MANSGTLPIRRVPVILERGRQARGQPDLPVHPAQEQGAEIG